MATLLFANEFGSGLGHLNRLIAVAKQFVGGHELTFLLPHKGYAPAVRQALGSRAEIRIGATWRPPRDIATARRVPTHTFADTMQLFGFHEVQKLAAAAQNCAKILDETAPDVIVSDFAPTLRLASAGRIPTIVLGSGYTVPPASVPLPPMRPWERSVPPQSRLHEFRLLAAANQVCVMLRRPAVDFLSDLFQGDSTFVSTLPEFDPYQKARSAAPLWPFNVPDMPEVREFSARRGPPVFCYMKREHPALNTILDALGTLDCESAIYVGETDPARTAPKCTEKMRLHDTPADFRTILPETSILIHHGGLGTSYSGLMAGVPQIIFPENLEQAINARGLQQFNVGLPFNTAPPPSPRILRDAIGSTLSDPARKASALRAARDLQGRRDKHSLDRVVAACRQYL